MADQGKQQRDQRHDQKRRAQKPWRRWYKLPAWKAIRRAQLEREPLCERHKAKGVMVPANVVHHCTPHNGNWELFVQGPFESLCSPCHDGDAQQEEIRGHSTQIGADGWPVDPRHPGNGRAPPARRTPRGGGH